MHPSFFNPELLSLLGLLLVSGAFAGLLAGLFGVGGGIILVPALFYVFDELGYSSELTTQLAVGTTLGISFQLQFHRPGLTIKEVLET